MKSDQRASDPGIRIVWWNTGLSPTRDPLRADQRHFAAAARVLRHLSEVVRADVIVLGEMAEHSVKGLRDACPEVRRGYTWLSAFQAAGRSRFSVCVLSRAGDLQVRFSGAIVLEDDRSVTRVGQLFSARCRAGHPPLHLIVSHWPSRLHMDRRDSDRTHIAAFLRRWIDDELLKIDAQANIVLVGDYNDEPFDEGLERYLKASRDHAKVKQNPRLLYNPFWRHLSSFKHHHPDLQINDAGTYFHPGGKFSHWHTFDQLMVSSALLFGRAGWQLNEESTRVCTLPEVTVDDGADDSFFDHLPIVGHLERRAT